MVYDPEDYETPLLVTESIGTPHGDVYSTCQELKSLLEGKNWGGFVQPLGTAQAGYQVLFFNGYSAEITAQAGYFKLLLTTPQQMQSRCIEHLEARHVVVLLRSIEAFTTPVCAITA